MENKLKRARVIASGIVVEVYKLAKGGWCNYTDCKTEYCEDELKFIK